MGYNLTIVKKSSEPSPDIEKLVFSHISSAKCISRVAAELSFQLPIIELPKFKDLFTNLDAKLNELNIASYGISITTLEEVFLKVAEGTDISHSQARYSRIEKDEQKLNDFELDIVRIRGNFTLFFVHFWALVMKRMNYFKRDKKGLICEIILPCIVVVVGLCLTFIKFIYPSPALEMSPTLLTLPIELPIQSQYTDFYKQNLPNAYYSFLTSDNIIDNNNVYAFDNYTFNERNINENGLYGAYYIYNLLTSNFRYLALVTLYIQLYI